jgi:hypothetical protein
MRKLSSGSVFVVIAALLACMQGCARMDAGEAGGATSLSSIPADRLLISYRQQLSGWSGEKIGLSVGDILVNAEDLAKTGDTGKESASPHEADTAGMDLPAKTEKNCILAADAGSQIREAVAKALAREKVLAVEIVENASAELNPAQDEGRKRLENPRYFVDGAADYDEKTNRVRVNLRLFDVEIDELIGTTSRAGASLCEASESAAEGILQRIREDLVLYLLKEDQR